MIDHISLGTHRFAEAVAFYSAAFAALGYYLERRTSTEAAFGPTGESIFWLYEVSNGSPVVGEKTHVAVKAGSPEQVNQFHAMATQHGGVAVRAPGKRPDISPLYFGTVITDRDGHTIEVVYWSEPNVR